MPATMKAARVYAPGAPLEIEDVPIPVPGPRQVLVRVEACGVCHSDVHLVDGDWGVTSEGGFTPGHEVTGRVAAAGPQVTSLAVGDRVGVPWLNSACGTCEYCLSNWETLCPHQQNTGLTVDGGFAEYALADSNYAAALPDKLDPVVGAPILCAGLATYKGIKETECRPGQWLGISGIGGLGHVAVQYAVAMGLRVVALDVDEAKLEMAKRLGAELAFHAADDGAVRAVRKATGGVHGALVTAVSTAAFQQALGTLRRGGTCVPIGLPPGEFAVPIINLVIKRLTIRGSIVGSRLDLREALEFAAAGKVQATIERQPLERVNDVLDRLRQGDVRGRIVLEIG